MLSESRIKVVTEKVGRLFVPHEEQYPHYKLVPIDTDRQGYLCLLFYINRSNFLVLKPRIKTLCGSSAVVAAAGKCPLYGL